MKDSNAGRAVRILGVPMDLGAGRRGVDMGPSGIRLARVATALERLGYRVHDAGDVAVPLPEARDQGDTQVRFLNTIHEVCTALLSEVESAITGGQIPLILGGDHSIAMGTVAGVSRALRSRGEALGLLWVDAHADMNTAQTSPSGNVHGMPLAVLLGHGARELVELGGFSPKLAAENVCLIGLRDLDDREKELVRDSGVGAYTMREIDERGIAAVAREAMDRACDGTAGFHLSFDLDGLDPEVAPGVGTPVKGGITWREAHLLMEMVADSRRMLSMEVTELNPILDDGNRTGRVAVQMIASAFGKAIL